MKEQISFEEFLELENKLEIKTGCITLVEEVEKSKKLLKLTVDFGEEDIRTVVTNIKPKLDDFMGLQGITTFFITNLKPVSIMGIESRAMILPQSNNDVLFFAEPILGCKLM